MSELFVANNFKLFENYGVSAWTKGYKGNYWGGANIFRTRVLIFLRIWRTSLMDGPLHKTTPVIGYTVSVSWSASGKIIVYTSVAN